MDVIKEFEQRIEEGWLGQLEFMRKGSPIGADLASFLSDLTELNAIAMAALGRDPCIRGVCVTGQGVHAHLPLKMLDIQIWISRKHVRTEYRLGNQSLCLATHFTYKELCRFEHIRLDEVIAYHLWKGRCLDERQSDVWARQSTDLLKEHLIKE